MDANLGGPFGAVIVRGRQGAGRGLERSDVQQRPTAHAEVTAIRRACQAVGDFSLEGATLYTSCEPCPMCLASAYWARISRIVYSNTRDDAAAIGFDDAFIYDEMPKDPGGSRDPDGASADAGSLGGVRGLADQDRQDHVLKSDRR